MLAIIVTKIFVLSVAFTAVLLLPQGIWYIVGIQLMNRSAIVTSRSLYSGDDTDMSTTRGYYANDLIRETWLLERHRGGMAREGFGGREPALDLEKQAGI